MSRLSGYRAIGRYYYSKRTTPELERRMGMMIIRLLALHSLLEAREDRWLMPDLVEQLDLIAKAALAK